MNTEEGKTQTTAETTPAASSSPTPSTTKKTPAKKPAAKKKVAAKKKTPTKKVAAKKKAPAKGSGKRRPNILQTDTIHLVAPYHPTTNNPRRGAAGERFAKLRSGMTVAEYKKATGRFRDLRFFRRKGYITIRRKDQH